MKGQKDAADLESALAPFTELSCSCELVTLVSSLTAYLCLENHFDSWTASPETLSSLSDWQSCKYAPLLHLGFQLHILEKVKDSKSRARVRQAE